MPIRSHDDWTRTPLDFAPPGPVTGVLVGPPTHFDITDVRNAHMEGQVGNVNREKALQQWGQLCRSIENLGLVVHEIDSHPEQVDAVFTANPSLCTSDREGLPRAIIGRMNHPNRVPESDRHHLVSAAVFR